ncbi:MAG TPA: hypothetical protein VEK32_14810 [Thermodesulfobacteriota bacterium]|nr:hypothetical protein [Thermodesulfobacteriota bacterium]
MKLKNLLLVLIMVFALAGTAFAWHEDCNTTNTNNYTANGGSVNIGGGEAFLGSVNTLSPSSSSNVTIGNVTGGTGGSVKDSGNSTNNNTNINAPSATIQKGAVTNTFTPMNSQSQSINNSGNATIQKGAVTNNNTVDPKITVSPTIDPKITTTVDPKMTNKQSQSQKQSQGQNNEQTINPQQEVTIKTPTQLLESPTQYIPSLNFGNGKMKDVTNELPTFAIYGIKKYAGESIMEVLDVKANVKFKNLYKEILSKAKSLAGGEGFKSAEVKVQILKAEAQKTWQLGLNALGSGSGLSPSGLGGGSGTGGLGPVWGGTKADDLFTIIYVKVAVN